MNSLAPFAGPWEASIREQSESQRDDFPNYYVDDPQSLITTSGTVAFELGTGASIYTNTFLPAILEADHEVILVTCFWAASDTQKAINETLELVAQRRREYVAAQEALGPDGNALPPLRIRICFSSRSLFQKLFHTSSKNGYVYPPSSWPSKLGLPRQEVLKAGHIDLQVKSLFFTPVSVMHPKFLIVDRRRAWFPSCNVSWEPWLEACIETTGPVVDRLLTFYRSVWELDMPHEQQQQQQNPFPEITITTPTLPLSTRRIGITPIPSPASRILNPIPSSSSSSTNSIPTVLLPSPHHRNPHFRPIPWIQSHPSPPTTPLNAATLRLLSLAQRNIYMQTPNLATEPVVRGLLSALSRGVDVVVVTCRAMMWVEQLVTAGTLTEWCVTSFIKRYKKLIALTQQGDVEQGRKVGALKVIYFHPDKKNLGVEGGKKNKKKKTKDGEKEEEEPVQSHVKLSIVDEKYTLLGSGNMDRPSWFTSQELGVLFADEGVAAGVRGQVDEVVFGDDARGDVFFDSF